MDIFLFSFCKYLSRKVREIFLIENKTIILYFQYDVLGINEYFVFLFIKYFVFWIVVVGYMLQFLSSVESYARLLNIKAIVTGWYTIVAGGDGCHL